MNCHKSPSSSTCTRDSRSPCSCWCTRCLRAPKCRSYTEEPASFLEIPSRTCPGRVATSLKCFQIQYTGRVAKCFETKNRQLLCSRGPKCCSYTEEFTNFLKIPTCQGREGSDIFDMVSDSIGEGRKML